MTPSGSDPGAPPPPKQVTTEATPVSGAPLLDLAGLPAAPRASGALWLPTEKTLVVSDLHLGKSERAARRGGPLLPPYETLETLDRLSREIAAVDPRVVLCLGDSFDDDAAADALARDDNASAYATLVRMMAGRRWIWVLGNHDRRGPGFGGDLRREWRREQVVFRHEAAAATGADVEVSGHYHPKATLAGRGRRVTRRCFLWDGRRLILPAFGAYTGGLDARSQVFDPLLTAEARVLLIGGRRVVVAERRKLAAQALR